ncbi:MAG: hypothetical protein U9R75_00225 [Candidatus Thermoplasmatota archaeon]|nr:hypothetical protein [Candidatus Thermoplasmatota archaeon]
MAVLATICMVVFALLCSTVFLAAAIVLWIISKLFPKRRRKKKRETFPEVEKGNVIDTDFKEIERKP